ncbi:MAG TPA: sugar ABC transporter substrate-binding protein [Rectinemataceae bacterium]|nr:sugar ABC transporter substrate-binding protein [Rectinemataceae bacterium]
MKRVLLSVLALAIIVGSGFAQGTKVLKKIILSNAYYTAPYCAAFNPSAIAKAKELGYELQILDGEGNQQKQLEHARLAIAEAAGFVYFPADVAGSLPIVEALAKAKLPYVIVNNYTLDALKANNVPCYVGTNVKQHGHNMATLIKQLLPKGVGNLVAIEGTAGHAQTIAFNEAFAEDFAGTQIKFLDKQPADFDADKALNKMNDFLTKYGNKIDVIVSHDGGMLAGIIASLRAAGKLGKIPIVCAGSNKIIYTAIKAGNVYGTSTQDPGVEGALAVSTLIDIINGKKPPQWVELPIKPATKETIDNFNWF